MYATEYCMTKSKKLLATKTTPNISGLITVNKILSITVYSTSDPISPIKPVSSTQCRNIRDMISF